jgi:hypothetical protein
MRTTRMMMALMKIMEMMLAKATMKMPVMLIRRARRRMSKNTIPSMTMMRR